MEKINSKIEDSEKKISYRVAALIIQNNKILIAKNQNNPLYYIIGGGIEVFETSEEAITREIFEEIGIDMKIDKLVFVHERLYQSYYNIKSHEIVFFYLMKWSNNYNIIEGLKTDNSKESLHWISLNELKNLNLVPKFIKNISLNKFDQIQHIIEKE